MIITIIQNKNIWNHNKELSLVSIRKMLLLHLFIFFLQSWPETDRLPRRSKVKDDRIKLIYVIVRIIHILLFLCDLFNNLLSFQHSIVFCKTAEIVAYTLILDTGLFLWRHHTHEALKSLLILVHRIRELFRVFLGLIIKISWILMQFVPYHNSFSTLQC